MLEQGRQAHDSRLPESSIEAILSRVFEFPALDDTAHRASSHLGS